MTSSREMPLPPGWVSATLGEVCGVLAGVGFPKQLQGVKDAEVPVFKVGDISRAWQAGQIWLNESPNTVTPEIARSLSSVLIPPQAVVFAKIGAAIALNRRAIIGRSCLVDNNVMALVPRSEVLNTLYAFYFACTMRLQKHARATTVPSIRKGDVCDIRIPVAPHSEQGRVVEAIESYFTRLDDAAATLERVHRNLERYRASVLKAAVEGRLVPTEAELARAEDRDYESASVLLERILTERRRRWEESELAKMEARGKKSKDDRWKARYKEPTSPRGIDLPCLPDSWCWATVEQLASHRPRSIQSGPFGSNLLHSEFRASGKLVIGIDNVQDGFFSMGSENRISEAKFAVLEKYRARPADVLVTVMATIGRTCVVPDELEPAIITKHVYRISVERELVSPRYLHLALLGGSFVREQIFGRAQGQTRLGLNGTIIKQLHIPLPPRCEQDRIVVQADWLLSIGEESANALATTERRCHRLRQSILKWAFEGRLVDQDPTDEPASVLLKRIREQTETKSTRSRGRGKRSRPSVGTEAAG